MPPKRHTQIEKAIKKKKNKFRLSAKGFFLTFPQCDLDKEIVRQRLIQRFEEPAIHWCLIGQEHHQDGNLHLHIALMFKDKRNFTSPNCFDFLTEQHGNYATMKYPLKAIAYCRKEDPNPLVIGVIPEASTKKQISADVAKLLMEGSSLADVNGVAPGFLLLNFKKIQHYQSWAIREKEMKNKEPWATIVAPADSTTPELFLINWLNKNIKQPRQFKQPQLLLQAPPDHRKTGLVRVLERYLNIMYAPTLEDFLDEWEDNTYDLLVFDEWEYQQHNPQLMNQLLDGQTCNLKVKGSQKRKTHNVPILILTNQTQQEAFGKGASMTARATLLTRLNWVILSRPLPLEMIFGRDTGGDLGMGPPPGSERTTMSIGPQVNSGLPDSQNSQMNSSEEEEERRRRLADKEEAPDPEIIDLTEEDDYWPSLDSDIDQ